ncbi:MAG: tail fiber domain-containing protein [Bacteroidota bacterium]
MKKVILLFCASLFATQFMSAQLKVRSDGSVHSGYTGYSNLWLGNYAAYGYNNGEFGLENWGGNLNIWKPWPSPFNGINRNYYLFINVAGGVGVGKAPTNSGIVLDVAGHVYASSFNITSDERLKNDIAPLTTQTQLIYSLHGKSYKKHLQEERLEMPEQRDADGNLYKAKNNDNVSANLKEVPEFGFIAQELKEVYPELVSQDTLGYYSINYIGLIPLLVEALKTQKLQIDELTTKVNDLSLFGPQKVNSSNETLTDLLKYSVLEQNVPNPFNTSTSINYYLPSTVSSANLYIYDMNGGQLKNISLIDRGKSFIIIQGNELSAGMYLYALIADGKVIDTKRMILTK